MPALADGQHTSGMNEAQQDEDSSLQGHNLGITAACMQDLDTAGEDVCYCLRKLMGLFLD